MVLAWSILVQLSSLHSRLCCLHSLCTLLYIKGGSNPSAARAALLSARRVRGGGRVRSGRARALLPASDRVGQATLLCSLGWLRAHAALARSALAARPAQPAGGQHDAGGDLRRFAPLHPRDRGAVAVVASTVLRLPNLFINKSRIPIFRLHMYAFLYSIPCTCRPWSVPRVCLGNPERAYRAYRVWPRVWCAKIFRPFFVCLGKLYRSIRAMMCCRGCT